MYFGGQIMIERVTSSPGLKQSIHIEETKNRVFDKNTGDQLSSSNTLTQADQNVSGKTEKEQLEKIVDNFNDLIPSHTSLKFELHEKLEKYYVKVIDDKTKEVVKEIPSKKMLDMYAAMKEFLGLMVDEKI